LPSGLYFACVNFFIFLMIAQRTISGAVPGQIFAIFFTKWKRFECRW